MGKYTLHKGIQHCELAMPETAAHPQSHQPRRPTGCGICTVILGMDVGGGSSEKEEKILKQKCHLENNKKSARKIQI